MIIVYGVIIFIAVILEGFFSGSEIAIISLNRIRLRILSESKISKAILIQNMLKDPNRLLATTLVGTNIAVVVASAVTTKLIHDAYNINSEWITTLILAPIILIFAEFIPKAIFSQSADRITFSLASFLEFFWKLFYPLVWFVRIFVNAILRLITGRPAGKKKSPFVTTEEIKYLIKESESEGEIDNYERSIIYKIFDFGKKKLSTVMENLDSLEYISDKASIELLMKKAKESGFSRFPVRKDSREFLGIINILDVVYEKDKTQPIKDLIRPIEYISKNVYIDNALYRLQSKKQTLAIVVDDDEKPVGFFTMEDLLEELVGEID